MQIYKRRMSHNDVFPKFYFLPIARGPIEVGREDSKGGL